MINFKNLTNQQQFFIEEILEKVFDNLSKNEDGNYQENSENWMITLSKQEYNSLKKILNN